MDSFLIILLLVVLMIGIITVIFLLLRRKNGTGGKIEEIMEKLEKQNNEALEPTLHVGFKIQLQTNRN